MTLSRIDLENVGVTSLQRHEWDLTGTVPEKLADSDYGYVVKGRPVAATRERLIKLLVDLGANIQLVWTPETPAPVPPEEVPFLVDAFRRILVGEAGKAILFGGAFVAVGVLVAIGLDDWELLYQNIFFIFGAVIITEGIWRLARSRNYTQEDAMSDASTARFTSWIKSKRLSGYTVALVVCIGVVAVSQLFVEDSIEVAGLVKPAVRRGEIWRLFTATLMHANFTHLWMNGIALLHFSRIIEQTVQRAYVPLVFLVTGAIGSVFSLVLYPNSTSVGASGGLMGLLGFITIAARFDRTRYPPKYFRQMIEAIVLIGAFGLFGFAFIDNAAHAGGLAGGLILGWLLLRNNGRGSKRLEVAALAALLVLGFVTAFAVYRIVR